MNVSELFLSFDFSLLLFSFVERIRRFHFEITSFDENQFSIFYKFFFVDGPPSKPHIELRPPFLDVVEYSPAEVECVAKSSTPVTFYWTRLDGELSPDAYASGALLRFNQVQRSDSGNYQCIARNQYGDDTSVLQVYVRESETPQPPPPPPDHLITIQPSRFTGQTGDVLVLTCRHTFDIYAPLTWTKFGSASLAPNVEVRDGVLTIQSAAVRDSGRYVCTTTPTSPDQSIDSITQTVDVTINDRQEGGDYGQPPTIKTLDEQYLIVQGSDFSLTCEASGNPYPTIVWKKVHEDSLGANVQQIGNVLKITRAQIENRGIYLCTAQSNGQTVETNTIIEVECKLLQIILPLVFRNSRLKKE